MRKYKTFFNLGTRKFHCLKYKNFFQSGLFLGKYMRNFFREKFWRLGPESVLGTPIYNYYYNSSILLPSKNSAIKLLNDISTLMQLSPLLLPISWHPLQLQGLTLIADFTGFFHLTYNIFVDFISFSWLSINALTCSATQSTQLFMSIIDHSGTTRLL